MLTYGCRFSHLLWSLIQELDTPVAAEIKAMLVSRESIDFLHIEDGDRGPILSYLPTTRKSADLIDNFVTNKRQAGRIGATIRKILRNEPTDYDLKEFHEMLSSLYLKDEFDIETLVGDEMLDAFNEKWYPADSGNSELGKSCMRYDYCRPWLSIYTQIPEVSLVVAKKPDNKIHARALVWTGITDVVSGEKVTMVDRIYAAGPRAKNAIIRHMRHADYLHMIPKNCIKFRSRKTGKLEECTFRLPLATNFSGVNGFPWVDSLNTLNISRRELANRQLKDWDNDTDMMVRFHNAEGKFVRLTEYSPRGNW